MAALAAALATACRPPPPGGAWRRRRRGPVHGLAVSAEHPRETIAPLPGTTRLTRMAGWLAGLAYRPSHPDPTRARRRGVVRRLVSRRMLGCWPPFGPAPRRCLAARYLRPPPIPSPFPRPRPTDPVAETVRRTCASPRYPLSQRCLAWPSLSQSVHFPSASASPFPSPLPETAVRAAGQTCDDPCSGARGTWTIALECVKTEAASHWNHVSRSTPADSSRVDH